MPSYLLPDLLETEFVSTSKALGIDPVPVIVVGSDHRSDAITVALRTFQFDVHVHVGKAPFDIRRLHSATAALMRGQMMAC